MTRSKKYTELAPTKYAVQTGLDTGLLKVDHSVISQMENSTMRRTAYILLITALAFACGAIAAPEFTQDSGFWTTPTIQGYGKIHMLPKAAYQPDQNATYKVVFALTKAAKTPADVNPSLDHVARAVNLYIAAGVAPSHLKFVAIAYGDATPLALDDAHYQAKFGTANPNLKLINLLRADGVDVAVCGQAVAEHQFDYSWVDKSVTIALSGLTTVTVLEQEGYSLMPM